jgi:GNAT superfamily N-acetyltransferase
MRLHLEVATPGAPLRAAAAVRAAAFGGALPPGRSAWAQSAFIRGKTSDAWRALEAKVAGTDPDWAGIRVACLLASVFEEEEEEEGEEERGGGGGEAGPSSSSPGGAAVVDLPALPPGLASALATATDPSCCLPGPAGRRRWAVGTLDLNVGPALPSEKLRADPPPPPLPGHSSHSSSLAYLSNVAVAAPARRCGVAAAMVRHACTMAPDFGLRRLAVHAATAPARALYRRAGFSVAGSESPAAARARCEEPRTLFVFDVL